MAEIQNILNVSTTTIPTNYVIKAIQSDPLSISHVGDGIFLQSKTAKFLAGAFVWMALFITCQQVK